MRALPLSESAAAALILVREWCAPMVCEPSGAARSSAAAYRDENGNFPLLVDWFSLVAALLFHALVRPNFLAGSLAGCFAGALREARQVLVVAR